MSDDEKYKVNIIPSYPINLGRASFLVVTLCGAAIFSHAVAASWVIEIVLLVLVFVACYAFNMAVNPITARTINMTKSDLMQWAAAGCPETWERTK